MDLAPAGRRRTGPDGLRLAAAADEPPSGPPQAVAASSPGRCRSRRRPCGGRQTSSAGATWLRTSAARPATRPTSCPSRARDPRRDRGRPRCAGHAAQLRRALRLTAPLRGSPHAGARQRSSNPRRATLEPCGSPSRPPSCGVCFEAPARRRRRSRLHHERRRRSCHSYADSVTEHPLSAAEHPHARSQP